MPREPEAAFVPIPEDTSEADFQFSCRCGRAWRERWPIPIRVDAMGRRLKYLSCPKCDGKEISFILPAEEPTDG